MYTGHFFTEAILFKCLSQTAVLATWDEKNPAHWPGSQFIYTAVTPQHPIFSIDICEYLGL